MTNRVPESTLEPTVGRAVHRYWDFAPPISVLPLDQRDFPLLVTADPRRHLYNQEMTKAESLKDRAKDAGYRLAEEATRVGHKVGETLGESKDWVEEKAQQAGNKVEEAGDAARKKIHDATA